MDTVVTDNPAESRFEIRADGELAGWATYRPAGASIIIDHTEIDAAYGGRGLGGILLGEMLAQLRAAGTTVIPVCPFATAYIRRHPEYIDDVDPSLRPRFRPNGDAR